MTLSTVSLSSPVDQPPAMPDALAYRAPFLIEKLLKDHVVDTAEEAEALFTEVKRYLVLNQVDRSRVWKMYSLRVDEVWHQFVLFTAEYVEFCKVQFGRYVHHSPSNAPDRGQADRAPEATFAEFGERYRELFGVDLPELWDDATSVTPHRRILNDHAGKLRLAHVDGMIDLIVMDGHSVMDGHAMFSVNEIASSAMHFIAGTGAFYVRELPGALTDEEKVGLVSTLVGMKLLRVG